MSNISRAADAGHICAERLGDLHRERAHASRRAVDQDLLSRLDLALVAQTLQGGDRRDGNGGRLLKGDVGRFQRDGAIRANTHILGEGAVPPAEYLVARLELRHVPADCFDRARIVNA